MLAKSRRFQTFLSYYLKAKTKYKIQSPIVFKVCKELLESKKYYYKFDELERLRDSLLRNTEVVPVVDMWAGSLNTENKKTKAISEVARMALSPEFKCQWLFKLVLIFEPKKIIELGTCLGLSSLYLASARSESEVLTIEGSPAYHEIAKQNFKKFKANNINAYLGNFDVILPDILDETIEMVYVDGNHTKEATLRYFNMIRNVNSKKMVIIFDDIYWSEGMTEAWEEIKKTAPYCIDLYYLGIVIFDPKIVEKQNFTIVPFRYKPWQIGLFG